MIKEAIVLYEDKEIRETVIDGQKWLSAVDVAYALGYKNPSRDIRQLLNRNKIRFEGGSKLSPLKNSKGGTQKTWLLNLEGVIMLCMISQTDKAIPFQKWAVKVLKENIQSIPNDIEMTIKSKRLRFTDTLKDCGISKPYEYINITKSMKENLGIDKTVKKADCDLIQKMKIALSEDLAVVNMLQENPVGYYETKPICDNSAKTIKIATNKELN